MTFKFKCSKTVGKHQHQEDIQKIQALLALYLLIDLQDFVLPQSVQGSSKGISVVFQNICPFPTDEH